MDGPEWNDVEAVAVQLADNTAIVCHYNRPSRKLDQRQLDMLFARAKKAVVAGDFNASHAAWGCHRNNVIGNILKRRLGVPPQQRHWEYTKRVRQQ
ncbi:Endonuclease-reverse transcriptase [Popillia japonica]|uniref:Endonuclease-reverse transcriptase n=1 Tax=Popillia japonica TaxID=7064 RepID=A0AAW1L6H0_POPJA